jgi:hypothetical protein
MKPFFVAAFLFLAMAMSVYNHQEENDQSTQYQHDEDRPVPPDFRHQGSKIRKEFRIHPSGIYIQVP